MTEEMLAEPNESVIAMNCTSPQSIAHYFARYHRHIVALKRRVDTLEAASELRRQQAEAQGKGEGVRSSAERPDHAAARREERERCAALVTAVKNLVDAAWDSQDWDGTRVGDALDEVDAAIRALGEE